MSVESVSFPVRHIGPTTRDAEVMLATVGRSSLDELVTTAVPAAIQTREPFTLTGVETGASETDALAELRAIAEQNTPFTSLIGQGYHGTITPPVLLRNVLENPAWYTAYTPYQPEISQGRLEAMLNFQTMIADLTGLELANASLLDEATAVAEAMTMCARNTRRNKEVESNRFLVDQGLHPQTLAVLETRSAPLGIELVSVDPWADTEWPSAAGIALSYPSTTGVVQDLSTPIERIHQAGGLAVVAADLLALTLLAAPGDNGADIVVGSAQRFGVPMWAGGPHAGYMAVTSALTRTLPGRLVGASVDASGRPAYRLTLQTREQHIRREKATSNICTAQALLAVVAGLYAAYHGPDGLTKIAERIHGLAIELRAGLNAAGVDTAGGVIFDTVTASVPGKADQVIAAARAEGYLLRRFDDDTVGVALDETSTPETVAAVLGFFGAGASSDGEVATGDTLPAELQRTSAFMTHPVFNDHHSETAMMRYCRSLADKDLALDRAMIPLGSCTMKLNAAAELIPISWPEFTNVHPFAPADTMTGTLKMVADLEQWLADITGYDAVSLQPNSGAQGELAGLLAIRGYHQAQGEGDRDVCLIPSSAHGTNAASAVMAGMRVVVVKCDDDGNIDLDDLRAKAEKHDGEIAACMITYPSTHGVFETGVTEVCDVVHEHGGQVYIDGANLNALVGIAQPGKFGGDVSHLNLHKTFAIPHGGGGPGVGPVACGAHLAPFLPGRDAGAVSAAPNGSAGVLPVSWMYLRMMGAEGLTEATKTAILSANYLAARLGDAYPVLYTGPDGSVAHECILDLRPLASSTGVNNEDVAKRLIDYGFHAPTMSFPVPGTLMVEPTESEPLRELDRFADAMLKIRAEIAEVEAGTVTVEDSVLRAAPFTCSDVVADEWPSAYSRETAGLPGGPGQAASKYWPPVSRVDNAHGDKHLMCSCLPIEALAEDQ